jgi:hypothetical protein
MRKSMVPGERNSIEWPLITLVDLNADLMNVLVVLPESTRLNKSSVSWDLALKENIRKSNAAAK